MPYRLALALALSALVWTEASAQQNRAASTQYIMSVEANLVVEPAIVRDKNGALVNGLTEKDFVLTADGVAQTIRYLDHDTDVPLTVGLLVDISASVKNMLEAEKKASENFLDSNLAPVGDGRLPDKAFVMQFSHVASILQDVTDSRPALASGLERIGTNMHRGGTALYDALFLASTEVMSKQSNRRAVIVLTDGVDNGSKETMEEAIEAAQRAHVVVYAMYYEDPYQGMNEGVRGMNAGLDPALEHTAGKKVLEHITSETGGRTFEIASEHAVAVAYGKIAEELRSQYRIGFTPNDAAAQVGYHHIQLQVVGKSAKQKLKFQIPDGYYYGKR